MVYIKPMLKSLLIVEDDKNLQNYLKEILTESGYSIQALSDGTRVIQTIEKIRPSVILLDLGLPTIKGEAVCKEVKAEYPDIPIIVLTGKDSITDKVNAFEMGADDYITKPFAPQELLARIAARLKPVSANNVLQVGDLVVDTASIEVKRAEKQIKLTPQEFKILVYMMSYPGKVLSREALLNKIWPNSLDIQTRVIDVYVSYLRKKIDKGQKDKLIQSVRGFGYTIKRDKK